jgi:UDP-N-acetylmuramyl tripeptide synthase
VCVWTLTVTAETLQEALANVKGPRGRLERVTVDAMPVDAMPVDAMPVDAETKDAMPVDKADNAAELHDAPDADGANGELHASGEDDPAELHPVVFVDYAHTPDALQHVCDTLRNVMPPSCQLHVVFGCGGDRDRGKRPLMGAIAERLAHRVTVTSDNPRSEDPMAIIEDILQGCSEPDRIHVEADRRKAVREAVTGAAAGDVVLIAGKGHETTQETAGVRVHLDDTEEARLALQSRKEVQAHKDVHAHGDAQARAEVQASKEAQARGDVRGGVASPINPRKENGEVA